ncbi:MAG: RluA family pseudouridine synthase [Luteolibacter sp.]
MRILYQDDHLVAIDKPAGMLVHPVASSEKVEPCAMKLLRDHLGQRVFIINRLDRPTSGILLFALDKKTAAITQQAFEKRKVTKTYLAIVNGETTIQWQCKTPLRTTPEEDPKPAETDFQRIAITQGKVTLSLLRITPTTGRYHQIRRHLLEAGVPI